MMSKFDYELSVYIAKADISKRLKEIAIELSERFYNECPVIIGVLNGSFIFMSDLIRELDLECEIDFMKVSSYSGEKTTGKIQLEKDLNINIKDRSVIIIEDIIDSGLTIDFIRKHILGFGPREVTIVTLLSKKMNYRLNFDIDIIGFEITSEFVVGYGLDLDQKFRQLDSLYKLEPRNLA